MWGRVWGSGRLDTICERRRDEKDGPQHHTGLRSRSETVLTHTPTTTINAPIYGLLFIDRLSHWDGGERGR